MILLLLLETVIIYACYINNNHLFNIFSFYCVEKNQYKFSGTENGNNASANSPEKEENPFDIFMKRLGLL